MLHSLIIRKECQWLNTDVGCWCDVMVSVSLRLVEGSLVTCYPVLGSLGYNELNFVATALIKL